MMKHSNDYPKLRNIEVFPIEQEGQTFLCFRDPLCFSEHMIFLPLPLVEIVRYFDGNNAFLDIQRAYEHRFGHELPLKFVEELVAQLDQYYFLESERFEKHQQEVISAYLARSLRPPFLAGKSYPADPVQLTTELENYFLVEEGPSWPEQTDKQTIAGIIAPHIDFRRGGYCYAWAYREIIESVDADVFIVLGTIHSGTQAPFVATRKHFETPFGTLPVDDHFLDALEKRYGKDLYAEEAAHRAEHSIEFQAVFLQSIYNNPYSKFGKKTKPITFVPILCSILHDQIEWGASPREHGDMDLFFQAMRETIAAEKRRVLIIASADLSHIGPQFGDPEPLKMDDFQEVAREDMELIASFESLNTTAFVEHLKKDFNRRRVCGVAPIYTLMNTIHASSGKLLQYGQWPDPNGTVTFSSLVFPRARR